MAPSDNRSASTVLSGERSSPTTKQQILHAAIAMFAEHGFEATSLRQIAAQVGIEAGSLYNHISSKQDLLFQLMSTAMDDIIAYVEDALAEANGGPQQRLAIAVRAHIAFYCDHQQQARVGERELRSLTTENFASTSAQRRRYEDIFAGILEDGVREAVFRPLDVRVATYGILGMCSNVALWFRPDGRLSPDEVADTYVDMVLASVLAEKKRRRSK